MKISVSKKSFKKVLTLLMAVLIAMSSLWTGLGMVSFAAEGSGNVIGDNVIKSGYCGTDVEYILYQDGKLVISGSGEMNNYDSDNMSPLYFSGDIIKSVVINSGVTTIGSSVFKECYNLESVTIPDSVISIGQYAFYYCKSLTSVTIPDGVQGIGIGAFSYCDSLASVTIPDSVEYIGSGAFSDCSGLEGITVDHNNEYYFNDDSGVLFNGDKTELIQYPCGIKKTTYTIPDGVTSIDQYAFSHCSNLESVSIPNSVTSISSFVFYSCDRLIDVYYLGTKAQWDEISIYSAGNEELFNATIHFLEDCSHANKTSYPQQNATCTVDGYTAGVYCSDCEKWISGHELITASHKDDDANRICDVCQGEAVLAAGYWEEGYWKLYFDGVLEAYGFECSVEPIPHEYQSFVREVVISYNMGAIGSLAFCQYINLKKVTIPDSVRVIGAYAFSGCASLESVTIPSGVIEILENTFANCASLEKIVIPEGVTCISTGAFSGCTGLKEVYLPSTIKSIYSYNFADENNLDVYFNGTEEQWEEVYVSSTNETLLNATIHFLDSDCTHENQTSHPQQNATCTVDGYTAGVYCPDCDTWLSGHEVIKASHTPVTYTQEASCGVNGYKLTSCSVCGEQLGYELIPAVNHNFSAWRETKKATCTANGEERRSCSYCGTVETKTIELLGHEWSAWNVTEATLMSAGEKVRTCSRCKLEEKEIIPKLEGEVSEDAYSGVKVEYTDDSYNGEKMQVVVEEDFTGSQYLGQSYGNFVSWNIKTYVNGLEIQPDAPVLVTIPIPASFNRDMIVVYHVDSITGKLEKIDPVVIEGNNIKFLASSFSVYMLVDGSSAEEKDPSENCSCMCHKTGFMKIIYKIVSFFWKLFKINPICDCGVAHY